MGRINIYLLLCIIILAGLNLRVISTRFKPIVFPDALEYIALARDIQSRVYFSRDYDLDAGILISRRRPPLYSALIALLSFLSVDFELAGAWLSIIASLLTILPLFWLGRRLESQAAGLFAAALFSFHHFILIYAGVVHTEALFTLIFVAFLGVSIPAFSRKSALLMALLGMLSALAYMTRDPGISLVFLAGTGGLIFWSLIQRIPAKRIAVLLGVLFGVFTLLCLPYWINIRLHQGEWGITPQMKSEKLAQKVTTFHGTRFDRDMVPGIELKAGAKDNSARPKSPGIPSLIFTLAKKELCLSRRYTAQFLRILGRPVSLLFYIACFIIGYQAFRERDRIRSFYELYLLAGIGQLILLYAIVSPYMVDERYMYPLIAPGILIASMGAIRASRLLSRFILGRESRAEPAIIGIMVFLIIILLGIYFYPRVRSVINFVSPATMDLKLGAGYKEAAQEIKARGLIPPGKIITDRKSFLAYYLNCRFRIIPRTPEELDELIRERDVEFLAADNFTFMHTRPLLIELAFGFKEPPGARVIYSRAFPEYRRVVTVYALESEDSGHPENREYTPHAQGLDEIEQMIVDGYLYDAVKAATSMIDETPHNPEPHLLLVRSYERYYRITELPGFLPLLIASAENYILLRPRNQEIKGVLEWARAEQEFWKKKARVLMIRSKAYEHTLKRF